MIYHQQRWHLWISDQQTQTTRRGTLEMICILERSARCPLPTASIAQAQAVDPPYRPLHVLDNCYLHISCSTQQYQTILPQPVANFCPKRVPLPHFTNMTMTSRFASTSDRLLDHSRSQLRPTNWDFDSANSPPLRPCHQPSFLAEKDVRFTQFTSAWFGGKLFTFKNVHHSDVIMPMIGSMINLPTFSGEGDGWFEHVASVCFMFFEKVSLGMFPRWSYTPCSWLTLYFFGAFAALHRPNVYSIACMTLTKNVPSQQFTSIKDVTVYIYISIRIIICTVF